jgi:hypothetical protein
MDQQLLNQNFNSDYFKHPIKNKFLKINFDLTYHLSLIKELKEISLEAFNYKLKNYFGKLKDL